MEKCYSNEGYKYFSEPLMGHWHCRVGKISNWHLKNVKFVTPLNPDAYGNSQRGLQSFGFSVVVLRHHHKRFACSAVVHQTLTVYCSCLLVNDKVVSVVSSQRVLYFSVFSRVLVCCLKPKAIVLFEKKYVYTILVLDIL